MAKRSLPLAPVPKLYNSFTLNFNITLFFSQPEKLEESLVVLEYGSGELQ